MSSKARARSNRAQKIIAVIVLVSMVMGGLTFFAAAGSTPATQPTPTQGL